MTIDMKADTAKVEEKLKLSESLIDQWIGHGDYELDDDGYPTETALDIIREWTFQMDEVKFFEFIKSVWWMSDWGWKEGLEQGDWKDEQVYRYHISTGGWSGNEDIIRAFQENKYMMWHLTWIQSRRGGHYIFELKEDAQEL